MTTWRQTSQELPDDLTQVWVSDNKTVGISEYIYAIEDWAYCEAVLGPITCWLPIEYPDPPKS